MLVAIGVSAIVNTLAYKLKREKARAFTLIELLVVISIIAVLMAILMPALRLAKDQGYGIICVNNQRSLSRAWYLYKDDHDDKLVGGHVGGTIGGRLLDWVDKPASGSGDPLELKKEGIRKGLLWPYVKEIDVYRCPADLRKIRPPHWAFRTYSISGNMNGQERLKSNKHLQKYTEIRNPTVKYVFVEECVSRGWNKGSWLVNRTGTKWIDPLAIWHNKRSTLGFADGHAEKHRWVDNSTIDMAERAAEGDTTVFGMIVPDGEGEDLQFMQRYYQLKDD